MTTFLHVVSGDYRWISYEGADTTSDLFGKGLRSLGLQPKANVCIYADTRSEWFLSAIACFQQGTVTSDSRSREKF